MMGRRGKAQHPQLLDRVRQAVGLPAARQPSGKHPHSLSLTQLLSHAPWCCYSIDGRTMHCILSARYCMQEYSVRPQMHTLDLAPASLSACRLPSWAMCPPWSCVRACMMLLGVLMRRCDSGGELPRRVTLRASCCTAWPCTGGLRVWLLMLRMHTSGSARH